MLSFIQGNFSTIIICAGLAALFLLAIRHIIKKKGSCDCGASAGCSGCSRCTEHNKK